MIANSTLPKRRSIRLSNVDYSAIGAYFITLVSARRRCIFGEIIDGRVVSSGLGALVQREWMASPSIRKEIVLGSFVLMPNHLHALVMIKSPDLKFGSGIVDDDSDRPVAGPTRASLGSLVGGFKSATTKQCRNLGWSLPGTSLWQRNYFEHVVRNEDDLASIENYIADNPKNWPQDGERLKSFDPSEALLHL